MPKKPKAKDWRSGPRPWARKPEGEVRSASIDIRVTPAEREAIHQAAERMGISLAELCRRALAEILNSRTDGGAS